MTDAQDRAPPGNAFGSTGGSGNPATENIFDAQIATTYSALIIMALIPIYYGSFLSLDCSDLRHYVRVAQAKTTYELEKLEKKSKQLWKKKAEKQSISSEDAYLYPVMMSAFLFTLYAVFKLFDKSYVNMLFTVYFGVIGTFCMTRVLEDVLPSKAISTALSLSTYTLKLKKKKTTVNELSFSYLTMFFLIFSILFTCLYTFTKHWILADLFALSFAINAITLAQLDSFGSGMVLLAGLFVYDIFWVFGTNVMLTVAKGIDAPVKVLWPKNLYDLISNGFWYFIDPANTGPCSMLGLGDIVLPGIYVALCLRFDYQNHMDAVKEALKPALTIGRKGISNLSSDSSSSSSSQSESDESDGSSSTSDEGERGQLIKGKLPQVNVSTSFPKPYFITCFIFYFLGLIVTLAVMTIFKSGQPALLYLSPACIISSFLVALFRGELKKFFAFRADADEKAQKEKQEEKAARKEKEALEKARLKRQLTKSKQEKPANGPTSKGTKNKKTTKIGPVAQVEKVVKEKLPQVVKRQPNAPEPEPDVEEGSSSDESEEEKEVKADQQSPELVVESKSQDSSSSSSSDEEVQRRQENNAKGKENNPNHENQRIRRTLRSTQPLEPEVELEVPTNHAAPPGHVRSFDSDNDGDFVTAKTKKAQREPAVTPPTGSFRNLSKNESRKASRNTMGSFAALEDEAE